MNNRQEINVLWAVLLAEYEYRTFYFWAMAHLAIVEGATFPCVLMSRVLLSCEIVWGIDRGGRVVAEGHSGLIDGGRKGEGFAERRGRKDDISE